MNFLKFLTEITWQPTGEISPQGKPRYRPGTTNQAPPSPRSARPKNNNSRPNVKPMIQSQRQQQTVDPQSDADLKPFLDAAKGNRQQAIELITLLGSIYQAKRRNPAVELNDTPKMANTPLLVQLFKAAKDKDLPQLAAMSNQIKKAATIDPNKPQNSGVQNTSQQPNLQAKQQGSSTPAQQTQLQQLLDIINKTGPNLTTRQIKQASKALNDKLRKAIPNQQPQKSVPTGGVIHTG